MVYMPLSAHIVPHVTDNMVFCFDIVILRIHADTDKIIQSIRMLLWVSNRDCFRHPHTYTCMPYRNSIYIIDFDTLNGRFYFSFYSSAEFLYVYFEISYSKYYIYSIHTYQCDRASTTASMTKSTTSCLIWLCL